MILNEIFLTNREGAKDRKERKKERKKERSEIFCRGGAPVPALRVSN
jgi:hypothetical protein